MKLGLASIDGVSPFGYLCSLPTKSNVTMGKSTHFFGQPVYGQLIKSLDRDKIVEMSRKDGGEKYVKSFNGFTHLLTMLYAIIMRFDSLREIEAAMTAEVRKLHHIGIDKVPKRSTLSDAMPGAQSSSLRRYTETSTTLTRRSFPRTADVMARKNG